MSRLALEIAGVRVDVELPGAPPPAAARYGPFAGGAGPAAWTIALRSERFGGPPSVRGMIAVAGRWRIPGAEEAGWLDPAVGAGEVQLDPALNLLDTLLRAAVGSVVQGAGGVLVHGAALQVDGAAHLFPARSGSGKSTLAGRARHPLSDELSILRPGPGGFWAHATPWWTSRGGAAPVVRLYSLAWGGEEVTPLEGGGLRRLAANLVLAVDGPQARREALAGAARVAAALPHARLAFRLDSDVDAILRRGDAGGGHG